MNGYEKLLVFGQLACIILIWIRFESRISRLEGRFDMFLQAFEKILAAKVAPHGS